MAGTQLRAACVRRLTLTAEDATLPAKAVEIPKMRSSSWLIEPWLLSLWSHTLYTGCGEPRVATCHNAAQTSPTWTVCHVQEDGYGGYAGLGQNRGSDT